MSHTTNFEIIAGTYEEYLLGYIFSSKEKTLIQSFASHDHNSSIRCLATRDHYLASGASDDRIVIYDLKARKEHCMLTHHDSTITALAFTCNHSHVISASQDGALAIVRVGNWQLEKLWEKAHKEGYILDLALHSSGKLALTLGSDGTIHTWNLVKGRAAYIINLKTKCRDFKTIERIAFGPDSIRFVIYGGKYTEIWSIDIGGPVKAIEHQQKVTCCAWLDPDTLFVGYEDGGVATIDTNSERKKAKQGHDGRVKAVQCFQRYIVTAASNGEIKVWSSKLKEICKVTTGCRITCLGVTTLIGKVKKEESEDEIIAEEAPVQKTLKRSVVVEVEYDSDNGEKEMHLKKKKRKKANEQREKTSEKFERKDNDQIKIKKKKKKSIVQ